ncbi:hypothetical protein FOZ63_004647 [Perkinsus olseni]|uniref:GH18 domain-containing protein n=1 Tax=Perkinsus olseni TaxID=32597 RepID=A0A7J6R8R9_PEROL|nr:hypothetical protein FOZ63_004647 [Perkinsus olseni]KAF4748320.1 hypothetical protein FOZ62_019560 [Perkinsus olseni]
MASICYLLLAALTWQSEAFEFYAYFVGEELQLGAFDVGVTELIFVGFAVSANGSITMTFSNKNDPDSTAVTAVLSARQAADTYTTRVSFVISGSIPFISDGSSAFSNIYASANNIVEKYKFDGINFDWEFPSNTEEWKELLGRTQ